MSTPDLPDIGCYTLVAIVVICVSVYFVVRMIVTGT